MKKIIISLLVLASFCVHAQDYYELPTEEEEMSPVNFGVGLGLSYGGIGARLSAFPIPNVGVFGAVGYNLHKAGYNVGGIVRVLPKKRVCPVVMGMYGYNAVIIVTGADEYNKTYYGTSFGGGVEIRFRNSTFLNLELLMPVRSQEWRDDFDFLLNNPAIEITEPLPVTFSIGYHTTF